MDLEMDIDMEMDVGTEETTAMDAEVLVRLYTSIMLGFVSLTVHDSHLLLYCPILFRILPQTQMWPSQLLIRYICAD